MSRYTFVYTGQTSEVMINSPYKQVFHPGERVDVSEEMAAVLKGHPEFMDVTAERKKRKTEEVR